MTGLDLFDLKRLVVTPALSALGARYASPAAINLLTGTALAESGCAYLAQIEGPALGLWQMEPATHADCWTNFLNYQPALADAIRGMLFAGQGFTQLQALQLSLPYACAMARVKYFRSPLPLPSATDAAGLSSYHKAVYNTALGAADAAANVALFQQAIEA